MVTNTKNVVFVIGTLAGGGAARVLVTLANHFSATQGYAVTIVSHRADSVYWVDARVRVAALYRDDEIRISLFNKIGRRVDYIFRLAKAIRSAEPNVVISFLRGMNWRIIVLCKLYGVNVIATEHTNHLAEIGPFSWLERRCIYKLASGLTVLTEFDFAYYAKVISSVYLIRNPLCFSRWTGRSLREKRILAAGDLSRWKMKGFDNLLDVFSRLSSRYPEWRLAIAGAGEAGKVVLMELARELQVSDKVEFLGFVPDLDREMRRSEIFVLSSRYEGLSMVLLEAMSQGCACVSFDCISGPSEMITSEVTGLLVENQNCEAMTAAVSRLIENPELRRELSNRGCEASTNCDVRLIAARWEEVMGL